MQPVPLTFADGTRLLILPHGGRVLGVFPPDSDDNFLWTRATITPSVPAISINCDHGRWDNPGGDRTWLAPEVDLFIGDLARPTATYTVPNALDPGTWTVTSATDTELCLTNRTRLRLQRTAREVCVCLTKRVHSARNPLDGTSLAATGIPYAGYTQITALEVEVQPDAPVQLGIWNLLQLPQPGVMLIPTREYANPQRVFGSLAADELIAEPHFVRWLMTGNGDTTKIALQATALTGRAAYLRPTTTGDLWDLVVRQFSVDPTGDYVDALWDNPQHRGWAFQACSARGAHRFNELEYHAPAVTTIAGANCRRDESCVWAYRGTLSVIAEVAHHLLGRTLGLSHGEINALIDW